MHEHNGVIITYTLIGPSINIFPTVWTMVKDHMSGMTSLVWRSVHCTTAKIRYIRNMTVIYLKACSLISIKQHTVRWGEPSYTSVHQRKVCIFFTFSISTPKDEFNTETKGLVIYSLFKGQKIYINSEFNRVNLSFIARLRVDKTFNINRCKKSLSPRLAVLLDFVLELVEKSGYSSPGLVLFSL